ncbi:MAG TPA: D-alanyl-D-alanine carboxypeptidase/D-alanyl-D-alanine-endopeptidase [Polyangiaceae bacterium]|nr:D-alanyl-D-alanine carboxypeptidase/D-alanyl-D-alanine-endopeptidase [Polyangiaceae bacterium]
MKAASVLWSISLFGLAFSLARLGHATPALDPPGVADAVPRGAPDSAIQAWAAQSQAELSLTVADVASGRVLFEHDGNTPRNPASVSKLVTALAALRTLGPNHRFKTTLLGHMENGSLARLVIRGEGDPSLSGDHIQGLAARLVGLGLTRISNAIVVDQSYFDETYVPPAFEQQPGEWAAFRAPVCATAVSGNRLVLWVVPGTVGTDARAFIEPFGAAELAGHVRTIDGATKGSRVRFGVTPRKERPLVQIGGEIGASDSIVVQQKRTGDPRMQVGYVLRDALGARGVTVPSVVSLGSTPSEPILLTHYSDALGQILYRLGKESDNFAAEMLLKVLGAHVHGLGSSESGVRVVLDMLRGFQAYNANMHWSNGSGLFDANRTSTNLLTQVLTAAYRDPRIAPEYLAQLSIAGTDGTLTSRLRKLPAGCFVRGKTGTLRSTISLAGYVERSNGTTLAFALIAENVKRQAEARAAMDQLVTSLCLLPAAS